jgi:hypothetical protein
MSPTACLYLCGQETPEKGGQRSILDYKRLWMNEFSHLLFVGYQLRSRSRLYDGYRACHWTQGSRVQSRQRAIKIRSTTSFGGEVEPSAPCRNILQHVKGPCRATSPQNLGIFLAKFLPVSLLGVSASICHRALVGESGRTGTQMGTHNR